MSASPRYHFASDNTAGICPEAWQAMQEANGGFVPSYGTDHFTEQACELFREFFEADCEIFSSSMAPRPNRWPSRRSVNPITVIAH